jgi:hypothetical protein
MSAYAVGKNVIHELGAYGIQQNHQVLNYDSKVLV